MRLIDADKLIKALEITGQIQDVLNDSGECGEITRNTDVFSVNSMIDVVKKIPEVEQPPCAECRHRCREWKNYSEVENGND